MADPVYNPWAAPIFPQEASFGTGSPSESAGAYPNPLAGGVSSAIGKLLGLFGPGYSFSPSMQRPDTSQENVRYTTASPLVNITDQDIGRGLAIAQGVGPLSARSLPMDEASRLARAAEQGYTIDAYKGGQPHDWNTMPEYYGSGKVVPGTENRVPQELTSINSPNAPYAGFFSNDPAVANRFAAPFEHGAVWPAKLKFDNPLVIDAKGKHAAAFQFESIARDPKNNTLDELKQFQDAFTPSSKHDGVILKNTKDEGDVYIPRNPDQIRSRFAAFDPANKGSGLLLGSGLGMLAAPYFAPSEQKQ